MRTTISLDERLSERLAMRAKQEGLSISSYIEQVLDHALGSPEATLSPPFVLVTVGGEGACHDVNLARTSEILLSEDQTRYGTE